ncbi:MAG TPA: endonuclease/exonuclease/phosphatase family protein [Pseudonocardiaceae bacterium]|nr:endonuclease/exonuclease/phosphatase family protein [Pseudonocardiaceae bacterium]
MRASTSSSSYHWQPAGLIDIPGTEGVEVVAVHTVAPVGRVQPAEWRAELADLPGPLPGPSTRLLVGDFNATLDHQPLRTLLEAGYRDAADVLGQGLRPTWLADTSLIPIAAIDHVLVEQGGSVQSFATLPLPGGDHPGGGGRDRATPLSGQPPDIEGRHRS